VLVDQWTNEDWRREADSWIADRVEAAGESLTGEIEQPHVRHWSTVLRVPTSAGDLWFKAVAPVHAFEPALTARLAGARPDLIPELVAVDVDRSWMLMRDGGTRLRELMHSADDLARWEELLPRYAELQLAAAPEADGLLALGVPDERLEGLAGRFERLLDDRDALLIDEPDGLTRAEYEQLRASVAGVERLAADLAGYGLPETIQHDDLHDGQIFVKDGRYLFFDWGDACISHPFHSLVVTLRANAWKFDLEPGGPEVRRLRNAYLEPFPGDNLEAAVDLAYRTGTVGRALAWHRMLAARAPEHRLEDAEAVPYGLKRFLADGPIGSWR
jgi:hypothetical protein